MEKEQCTVHTELADREWKADLKIEVRLPPIDSGRACGDLDELRQRLRGPNT